MKIQIPDLQKLRVNLKNFFDNKIWKRGVNYYTNGYIEGIKASYNNNPKEIAINGNVSGSAFYSVDFYFNFEKNSFSRLDCNCPYGDYCKHIAALGLDFIDKYNEFLKNNNEFRDVENFKEILMKFINNEKIEENNIIEGEFEENNAEKKELDKQLSQLANILGVDIGGLPKNIVENAREMLKAQYAKNDEHEKNTKQEILPLPKIKKPKAKPKRKKTFEEKYFIEIEIEDRFWPRIRKYGEEYNSYYPEQLLNRKKEKLNKHQEELLNFFINNSFLEAECDYGRFFDLIRLSSLSIFQIKDWHKKVKLEFSEEDKKLKTELVLDKVYNSDHDFTRHNFIFKLDRKYKEKGGYKLFFGKNSFVLIEDEKVFIQKIHKDLAKILNRIDLASDYGYRDKLFETQLQENEIIKIDKIIKQASRYLDFDNKAGKYNVEKFTKADPKILVDYDSLNNKLEAQFAVDYGFRKQDVGKSAYYSHGRHKTYKRRWVFEDYGYDYVIDIDDENIRYAKADKKAEINLYKNIRENNEKYGFTKTGICKKKNAEGIFDFYHNEWKEVQKIGIPIEHLKDKLEFSEENFKADFQVNFKADNDWLAFDVNCYCGEDRISLEDLRKYVENKQEFIRMADGRILKITNFEELERFILMLESFYQKEGERFEGKAYHAPELEDIFTSSDYYNAKISSGFKKFMKEAQSGKPVEKVKKPKHLTKILRGYQKDGIDWFYFLRKYRFAGILADDMGTGKTLQTLSLLELEFAKNKPSVVICPKSLLYNWQSEAKKFTPKLKTIVLDDLPKERRKKIQKLKKYDLVITSYAMMQRDNPVYEKAKIKFNYCVLDEAQSIKNHTTKNAQIVKQINADYRLALTGTPLENSVSEIWSIFDFLMPGFLGSFNAFTKKFKTPIMKHSSQSALERLGKKTSCFMLRRTKENVLKELPPKIEQVSHCHLEEAQNILYKEILANVKQEIFETVQEKGFSKSQIHILAGLTKLRQVCNHPALLLKDKKWGKYESAKLNMFLELAREIASANRKVLVFSQFTSMLDILAEALQAEKIQYTYLSGKTKKRQDVIKEFNENEKIQVFLISLKAGGVGLNLTSADNVIIFDPWWNPSVENQAVDRAHRIGQKKSVNVYRLITQGTIEEKIVALQEKKKFLFDNLVGESKDLFKKLTWDDVKELFR